MLALASAGSVDEGVWLRAERQTAGRGREGRVWISPPGNLYASTIVQLRPGDPPAPGIALVAAVALEETVSLFLERAGAGVSSALKWPNDLMLAGGKVSGMLLERVGDTIVVGLGVNLAHHPALPDRLAVSLQAVGCSVEPGPFLSTLAEIFAGWLVRWRREGLEPVRTRWLARAHPIGTALSVRLPDGDRIDGLFEGLDATGALTLRLASGERRVIHAGDVFLV